MKNDKQKEFTHTELKRSMPVSQIAVIGIGGDPRDRIISKFRLHYF